MKLKFWNRKPADNAADLEGLSVTLPKSGKEMTIVQLVNAADEAEAKKGMANADDKVKVGDKEMTVGELVKCYEKAENDLAQMAKNEESEDEVENEDEESVDNEESEDEIENEDEESVDNEDEDEAAKKKALELAEHEEKEILEKKKQNSKKTPEQKAKAKKNFESLKNAHKNSATPAISVDLSTDKLARGQQRYGSTH